MWKKEFNEKKIPTECTWFRNFNVLERGCISKFEQKKQWKWMGCNTFWESHWQIPPEAVQWLLNKRNCAYFDTRQFVNARALILTVNQIRRSSFRTSSHFNSINRTVEMPSSFNNQIENPISLDKKERKKENNNG